MADSVKKRCSKAKEVKAANKVELLKSCLDKKDFCGDAAYYSCMRKYFTLYPPESNNNSAKDKQKKNKVDACKGSMKFVPGDVVMGTLSNLISKFSTTQTKKATEQLENKLGDKKEELKYRATVKKVDDKFITLNFDDYHNFKEVITSTPQNSTPQKSTTQNSTPQNSNIVAFLKSLKTTEDEPTTTGGGGYKFRKTQEEKNKNKQQSYQLGQLKDISIPFEKFNQSDAVKYKPSSVMGHLKKGAKDFGSLLYELSLKPIINEGLPALLETKTNMGKDEEK